MSTYSVVALTCWRYACSGCVLNYAGLGTGAAAAGEEAIVTYMIHDGDVAHMT